MWLHRVDCTAVSVATLPNRVLETLLAAAIQEARPDTALPAQSSQAQALYDVIQHWGGVLTVQTYKHMTIGQWTCNAVHCGTLCSAVLAMMRRLSHTMQHSTLYCVHPAAPPIYLC